MRTEFSIADGIEQEESEENEVYYSRCENSLCNTVSTFLGEIYGVHSLLIARIDRRTQQFVTVLNQGNIAFDQEFQSVARAHVDASRIPLPDDVMQDLRNHAKRLTVEYPEGSGNKYLIAPMLVEHTSSVDDRQIIGCFITKAKRAGGLTAKAIDEISNALAYRVVQFDRSRRFDILNQFSKEVAELKPNNLTKQSILEIAHRHIKEIMFGDNLYISLYDRHKQEISFPLMYLNGKPKEQLSRIIDSNALGRTEEIILTKKPLRHRTKVESKAWYETPGHGEFMGNHLASWIGVPIFSPDGIQGVIAAYHPEFDAIYSKLDLFLLNNIASQVSGLLRSLDQSSNIDKLEEAKRNILLKESKLLKVSFAKDLAHKNNNKIGGALAQIGIAHSFIEKTKETTNSTNLEKAIESLNDAKTELSLYLSDLKAIESPKREIFNIYPIIESHLKSVKLEKRLDFAEFSIERGSVDAEVFNYKPLIDSLLHSLIDNAGDAIKESSITTSDRGFYVRVFTRLSKSSLVIDVKDNALPISDTTVCELFENEISTKGVGRGYGLARAKEVLDALGGSIELHKNTYDEKIFRIELPIDQYPINTALVVDDQRIWRNILSTYVENMGFRVVLADSLNAAETILQDMKNELKIIFLDLSFDENKHGDVQGLMLINSIKKSNPKARIVIVSGFSEKAVAHNDMVDLIINKTNDAGALTEGDFLKQVLEIL